MEIEENYLIDTNIWLERLLDQENSMLVSKLFEILPTKNLYISDFTSHSIGVILSRYKKLDVLYDFYFDLFSNVKIERLSLNDDEISSVIKYIKEFKLDFDDAYQYSIAIKHNLKIITFDKGFSFGLEGMILSPLEIINQII